MCNAKKKKKLLLDFLIVSSPVSLRIRTFGVEYEEMRLLR